jgi:putative transposase
LDFATKYRRGIFNAEHRAAMQDIMARMRKDFEAQLLEFNGEADHVLLRVNCPPKVALSTLVNSLSGFPAG